jgi:uncharacterized protein YbjT (DUF2867 family)
MQDTILITGASGNLGSKVVAELLDHQQPIKVTGRNAQKLSYFDNKTTVAAGNLEDETFLKTLLQDVTAVFLVLPQLVQLSIKAFAELFIDVAENSGVTHVVNISNCTLTRWGKPTSLLEFESYLNKSQKLHIKHLRCANFFENLNWGIQTPYRAGIKLPYISAYEIAYVASRYLQAKNFRGISVDELMGRQDYSMQDFANLLGVTYRQQAVTPENEWFFEAFNTGQYELVQRTSNNTSLLTDERFSLDYFLEHHFNKQLL